MKKLTQTKNEGTGDSLSGIHVREPEPNTNLMIIDEIEGLLLQANEKMYALPIHPVRSKAIEEIDVICKITVGTELRKVFE